MDIISSGPALPVVFLLIGVVATVLVARYYFKKTLDKSRKELTVYLDYFSEPLDGIDEHVRRDLKVTYKDVHIDNLIEVSILVANTGERPIRDIIQPLTMHAPASSAVVNATLLHVNPEGRNVAVGINGESNRVVLKFDLLNKDEFFLIKVLLSGAANSEDLRFAITVDDLPPFLEMRDMPYGMLITEDEQVERKIDKWMLGTGFAILVGAVSTAYFLEVAEVHLPEPFEWSAAYLFSIPLTWYAQWVVALVAAGVGIVGILILIAAVSDSTLFKKKKQLILPSSVQGKSYGGEDL